MEFLFGNILFSILGWTYMKLRYRNKERIKVALAEKYDDSYSAAGIMFIAKPLGALFLLLIVAFVSGAVYSGF